MKNYFTLFLLFIVITVNAQFNYQRSWATYYFGNSARISGSVIDSSGNVIVVGTISLFESPSYYTFFTTATAHQPQVAGGISDMFLAKFSPQGSLLWATYYGGEGTEKVNSSVINSGISLDSNDNIYIVGDSDSTTGIATLGAFLTVLPSNIAGFITKFSPAGQQLWGTYFPGHVASIAIDATDAIYVGGNTNATTNISSAGAFQQIAIYDGGGMVSSNGWNFFINKFDIQGNRLLGTYCGKADSVNLSNFSMAIDSENSIYISSLLYSDPSLTYSFASLDCHQPTRAGDYEIFLSKFNTDLTERLWSTYYGGSSSDFVYSIATDDTDVYLVGKTFSPNNIATVGSYQSVLDINSSDGFIVKFDGGGTRQWGSYYGGNKADYINCIKIKSGTISIVGLTYSTTVMATTGAYQETLNNGGLFPNDGFFAQFTTNGIRKWGSYYGGEKEDQINCILVNNTGDIFLSGTTSSTTNITTANALQPNFSPSTVTMTPNNNIFLAKFTYTPLGVSSFSTNNLQITPNPNNGNFVLQGTGLEQNSKVVVCDLQGRVIVTTAINSNNNESSQGFQLENILSSGVYLVKVLLENVAVQTVKVVVE